MKLNRKRDLGKSGIYAIRNLVNRKLYIGKAKCIYTRIKHHKTLLNIKSKDENRHLIHSWHKYGEKSFDFFVIEYLDLNEEILKQRELYWQRVYKVTDHQYGYNMREDSETGLICKEETRIKLKEASIKRFQDPKEREKCSHTYWKDNPEAKEEMAKKVSTEATRYSIEQYDKLGNLLKVWNSVQEIIKENPEYKSHNIYSVCSGAKPTIYGYIWKKILKVK